MKLTEPKNFKDILNLQAILDSSINSARARDTIDIRLSMIAEIIEFNEESKESHKTWKTKEHDKDKELEEYVDIWFFYAQFCNEIKKKDNKRFETIIEHLSLKIKNRIFLGIESNKLPFLYLIESVINHNHLAIVDCLIEIAVKLNYSNDDIFNCYWKKWQKNMERIGKEWN